MIRTFTIALLLSLPALAGAQQDAASQDAPAAAAASPVFAPSHEEGPALGSEGVITPAIPGVPKMFLPDIGIAGDFSYQRDDIPKADPRYNASNEQPNIRDGQFVAFSPIDPFTNAQFTIDLPSDGVANIEEAWIHFNKLPGDTSVRVGRFIPQFGLIDQLNTFQLATFNRPNAIGDYLSPDGLGGTGAEVNFYIPNPWQMNLKADLEAVGGNTLGVSSHTTDMTFLGTLDYSADLFETGSLQAGSSVGVGPSPYGQSEVLIEPYVQVIYAPTQRKVWTWSAEGMFAERQGLGSEDSKSGFYTYLDYNWALRYHVGLLFDLADAPVAPYGRQWDIAPNVTWFVSDNTRLRLQYTHTSALGPLAASDAVALQATFSLGNLKQLQ